MPRRLHYYIMSAFFFMLRYAVMRCRAMISARCAHDATLVRLNAECHRHFAAMLRAPRCLSDTLICVRCYYASAADEAMFTRRRYACYADIITLMMLPRVRY